MRWQLTDKALFFAPWQSILTLKAGSLEEYSLLERWGEPGQAPATLLLESFFQSARWLIEASSSFTLSCVPLEIDYWNVLPGLKPGERFCAFLRVTEHNRERVRFALRQGRIPPGKKAPGIDLWQSATDDDGVLTCALAPLEQWYLPLDRACLWQEIYA
ncbi:MAG: hypothetical protein LBU53_02760 [Zoogloeaceae bacterium]|jgi:hypothetical protein|nr:hypothetical protein [Zoogloeaceae bacterium]